MKRKVPKTGTPIYWRGHKEGQHPVACLSVRAIHKNKSNQGSIFKEGRKKKKTSHKNQNSGGKEPRSQTIIEGKGGE